jgi:hypothetical protein
VKAFIIFRDRVTYGHLCLTALTEAGLEPVVIDQGSTWPLAKDWLKAIAAAGVPVLDRGGGHPRGVWNWAPFCEMIRDAGRYIVTDPDVVPCDGCPPDWPAHLGRLLDAYPRATKAGLGLSTGDIPAHYQRRDQVIAWESAFWRHPAGDGAYWAGIDTTLAMYREGAGFTLEDTMNLRSGPPYLADHLAWHEDLDNPAEEITWYYEHAEPGIAHWTTRGHSNFGN